MNEELKKIGIFIVVLLTLISGYAQEEDDNIFEMSLEDLMNIEVTSVSKKAERLQDVASSIYVITSEDISYSGATTIHEVLRLVPGYWGVQSEYASAQSNIRYSQASNGLTGTVLYLLDGTPIQDLMLSNFTFRNFDLPIDEIDRIEVIRGSGGTVYGANSATGVVNIFTKNPESYDGINAKGELASGGYTMTSLRAGGKISEKLSLSGYGKMRLFDGFGTLAGTDADGNSYLSSSRFTENYDAQDMYSVGLKANYAANPNSSLTFKLHYNTLNTFDYSAAYGPNFIFTGLDDLYGEDINANRLVSSIGYNQDFSENHSMFVRVSTNQENDFHGVGGGYFVSNNMYDIEVQDNLIAGNHNLSFGANFRSLKFDIHGIRDVNSINYRSPQSTESLNGVFVQDKIEMAGGKFNALIGIKAENYTLVNDTYYFSPMLKLSYIPTDNFTLWGGYTQSYSTPGFSNQNIDLYLFQTPGAAAWTQAATGGVFAAVYASEIDGGATDAEATATASAYLGTQAGMDEVAATAAGLIASNPSVAVINGDNTLPSKFSTFELGFRANIDNQLIFESNAYISDIKDGVGVGADVLENFESPTQAGRFSSYFLYGNYVNGQAKGIESSVKIIPVSGINFELTHSFLKSTWENSIGGEDVTPSVAKVPSHVFRMRGNFALPSNFHLGMSMIYGTDFSTQGDYMVDAERYENLGITEDEAELIARNDDRAIISFRLEKRMASERMSLYAFGNDIFNQGSVANTRPIYNVTRSQIKGMFGFGMNYKLK